ncbi:hypothetical protein V6N13_011829 [Hibiscus sabdariffa]
MSGSVGNNNWACLLAGLRLVLASVGLSLLPGPVSLFSDSSGAGRVKRLSLPSVYTADRGQEGLCPLIVGHVVDPMVVTVNG